MKSFALLAAAAAAALVSPLVAGESTGGHPWGYSAANASVAAPDKWAAYYEACGGSRQSPVDLSVKSCDDVSESPLSFAGECSNYKLTESHESYKGAVVGGTSPITLSATSSYRAVSHCVRFDQARAR
jgi:carbonic anhydrase